MCLNVKVFISDPDSHSKKWKWCLPPAALWMELGSSLIADCSTMWWQEIHLLHRLDMFRRAPLQIQSGLDPLNLSSGNCSQTLSNWSSEWEEHMFTKGFSLKVSIRPKHTAQRNLHLNNEIKNEALHLMPQQQSVIFLSTLLFLPCKNKRHCFSSKVVKKKTQFCTVSTNQTYSDSLKPQVNRVCPPYFDKEELT